MSRMTLKGVEIPTSQDDLLASWERLVDTAGVIVGVSSVAEARVKLTQMEAAGKPVADTYFDVQGVMYRCAGGKKDGVWVLSPVNEVEYDEVTYSNYWERSLAAGEASGMMTSKLQARPYDRVVFVDAGIWSFAKTGHVDMALNVQGRMKLARIASGEAHSVSTTLQGIVRAGENPQISVAIRGGDGGGRAVLTADNRFNYLTVMAFPVTMS